MIRWPQLSDRAVAHFSALVAQEQAHDPHTPVHIRVFVLYPGTMRAEVGITFCSEEEVLPTDVCQEFPTFKLYIEGEPAPQQALEQASIDYIPSEDELAAGELSIKAPQLRGPAFDPNASLEERVLHLLEKEVNPGLAMHGGQVSFCGLEPFGSPQGGSTFSLKLEFKGGCQGCGMAGMTLRQGIEKTIRERCPEIVHIEDITDHARGTNPYFRKSSEEAEEVCT